MNIFNFQYQLIKSFMHSHDSHIGEKSEEE